MELLEKAWTVDLDKIDEGFLCCEEYEYAKTRNEAKQKLLQTYQYQSLNDFDKTEITYLNIPVKRAKGMDKFLFEGEPKTLAEIENIKERRERDKKLDQILENPEIKYCYIIKRYYYRPNYCGYTERISRAGVYTKEDAVSEARNVQEISVKPIDITEHNSHIQAEIEDLKTRLIA